jgi:hypothetical protein
VCPACQLPAVASRYERLAEDFSAFAAIASLLICHRHLTKITT